MGKGKAKCRKFAAYKFLKLNLSRYIFVWLALVIAIGAKSQGVAIKGVVSDAASNSPLAFVGVGIKGSATGTSSDIEGRFYLKADSMPVVLVFTYVGYEAKTVSITAAEATKTINITLKKKDLQLREVVVKAGPNPAEAIIKKVVNNRDKNDPEKLDAYTYTSYNKLILTANTDSLPKIKSDTAREKAIKFFERNHLFLLETVTDKKFKAPNLSNEYITGIRASGFKDPTFMALATQLQSFSFYKEVFELGDKTYLNPVSRNSEGKYLFVLEDTLYEGVDSVYVISFAPRRGKNFDAMTGVLYINTNGYAIQNVIARPFEDNDLGIKIQQKYELMQGKWFPVQLNTDLMFKNAQVNSANLVGIGRTYLSNIKIDPPLKRSEFLQIDLTVEPRATEKDDKFWEQNRPDTLDDREKHTYTVIDSIGQAQNFDKKIRSFVALSNGKIPIKSIDLEIDKLLRYNRYEGFRIGLGFHTNSRFSQVFTTGGYIGYGFSDKGFKWGADASVRIHRRSDLRLKASWISDVKEAGQPEIRGTRRPSYNEVIRNSLVGQMDFLNRAEVNLSFRTPGYLQFNLFGNSTVDQAKYSYGYLLTSGDTTTAKSRYTFTQAGVSIRFAFKEKLFDTGKILASLGTNYPVVYLQYTRGIAGVLGGEYTFNKVDLKADKTFTLKSLGRTGFSLWAGYIDRPAPYVLNYVSRANNLKGSFTASVNSFETMQMNEFLSDTYVNLFFRHNFQNLLFKSKKFRPQFVLITNAGWGILRQPQRHINQGFKTMEKVFLESGLIVNDVYRVNGITGLGFGIFYRYGAYALPTWKENLAVKLSLNLAF